jgi:hypothetical protein
MTQQKTNLYDNARESLFSSPTQTLDGKNPGLKIISRQVMDAVAKHHSTTYKDVANDVSKLSENNPSLSFHSGMQISAKKTKKQGSQEKNLRRRVYDSLNVLLAVGILQKGPDKRVYFSKTHGVN